MDTHDSVYFSYGNARHDGGHMVDIKVVNPSELHPSSFDL